MAALATTELPRSPAWLASFARLALTVGLRALELGVALEAHGQNLVVLSPAGDPLRLVYRDLADIRVSPAHLARHGVPAPSCRPACSPTTRPPCTASCSARWWAARWRRDRGIGGGAGRGTGRGGTGAAAHGDLSALCAASLPVKALTVMRLTPGRTGDIWTVLPGPLTA